MGVKFQINELGPIRDSVIEFKPFTILTGDSNTGKSYTAFLMYSIFILLKQKNIFHGFIKELINIDDITNTLKNERVVTLTFHLKDFEKIYNDNINKIMSYLIGYDNFKCDVKLISNLTDVDMKIKVTDVAISEDNNILFNMDDGIRISITMANNKEYIRLTSFEYLFNSICSVINIYLINKIQTNSKDNIRIPFFLPSARDALMNFSYLEKEEIVNIGIYREFFKCLDNIKRPDLAPKKEDIYLDALLKHIFCGKIEKKDKSYYYEFCNHSIPICAAASSIKEIASLYLILKNIDYDDLFLLIEEPGTSLHPDLQQKVAKLLSYAVNQGSFIVTTTHSDYFMHKINNLIKLGFIRKKNEEQYNNLLASLKKYNIDDKMIIDPEKVGAYYFEKDKKGIAKILLQEITSERIKTFDSFTDIVNDMIDERALINEKFYL